MRVVIVSDTHGRLGDLQEAVERSKPVDWVLHLGDVEGQQDEIADIAAMAGAKVAMVSGNNDFFSSLRKELELVIGGVRIWMTHGHQYSVYQGIERIKNQGIMRSVDVVCMVIHMRLFLRLTKKTTLPYLIPEACRIRDS